MKTSIIIPAFNEEKTILEVIQKVKELRLNKEIIVIDDGSTDNTWKIIEKTGGIKKVRHKKNLGKGAAFKSALKIATGKIIIVQDADMELAPEQIPKIISPILKGETKVVYGSRNSRGKGKRTLAFFLGGHLITFLTNLLYNTRLTDEPCGYKAFLINILKDIKIDSNRFEWEPEITAKLSKRGIKIHEVPVESSSRTMKEGKKLRRIDGVRAALTLIKYRFKD
jgi:glycosyltransferase involved in cell wall biosynthesis